MPLYLINDHCSYYIETNRLIGIANQMASFYMMKILVIKELKFILWGFQQAFITFYENFNEMKILALKFLVLLWHGPQEWKQIFEILFY